MQRYLAHQDMIFNNHDIATTRYHSVVDPSCLLDTRACLIHTTNNIILNFKTCLSHSFSTQVIIYINITLSSHRYSLCLFPPYSYFNMSLHYTNCFHRKEHCEHKRWKQDMIIRGGNSSSLSELQWILNEVIYHENDSHSTVAREPTNVKKAEDYKRKIFSIFTTKFGDIVLLVSKQ